MNYTISNKVYTDPAVLKAELMTWEEFDLLEFRKESLSHGFEDIGDLIREVMEEKGLNALRFIDFSVDLEDGRIDLVGYNDETSGVGLIEDMSRGELKSLKKSINWALKKSKEVIQDGYN